MRRLPRADKQGAGLHASSCEMGYVEVEPLTYIRGRSIPNQFMIVDEAQNLTPHEVKTIITRVGDDTKIVLTGDPYQIDNPYVDSANNGLTTWWSGSRASSWRATSPWSRASARSWPSWRPTCCRFLPHAICATKTGGPEANFTCARHLVQYLESLAHERHASPHTVRAYKPISSEFIEYIEDKARSRSQVPR